jgi:hypothetical protein
VKKREDLAAVSSDGIARSSVTADSVISMPANRQRQTTSWESQVFRSSREPSPVQFQAIPIPVGTVSPLQPGQSLVQYLSPPNTVNARNPETRSLRTSQPNRNLIGWPDGASTSVFAQRLHIPAHHPLPSMNSFRNREEGMTNDNALRGSQIRRNQSRRTARNPCFAGVFVHAPDSVAARLSGPVTSIVFALAFQGIDTQNTKV